MNFVLEMNIFTQWLEGGHLSSNAQLLWFRLFNLNNRLAWIEWMQVDNQRLMQFIKANSRNTMMRARDELIELGLLEYKRGKKGVPGSYKMIPPSKVFQNFQSIYSSINEQNNKLCSNIEQNTEQNTNRIRTEYEHDTNPINKLNINKTKLNISKEREVIKKIVYYWNDCAPLPIEIESVKQGSDRYNSLIALLDVFGMDKILEVISGIKDSNFLQGQNNLGWRIPFDWFVEKKNFQKVLEGNFKDNEIKNKPNKFHNFEERDSLPDDDIQALMEKRRKEALNA